MKDLYVASCCRTAVGTFGGSLKDVHPSDMGGIVIKEALNRAGIAPEAVSEVIFGCCISAGLGQNVARQASLKAGVPFAVPAYSVNMVCGSGMKTVIEGARAILAGDAEIVVCGGAENMSAAPYLLPSARWGQRMFDGKMKDSMVNDALWDAMNDYHMGTTANNIADVWGITRQELDDFALASQQKAAKALEANRFEDEIVAVPVKIKKQVVDFKTDEFVRPGTTAEGLAKLKAAFPASSDNDFVSNGGTVVDTFNAQKTTRENCTVGEPRITAGNAPGVNDGAAAIILCSEEAVKKYNLKPMAKLTGWGQGGVDPKIMGTGPVPAVRQAMEKSGTVISDFDLIEANEAFAAQSIAVARELGFDMEKVNVNGGAIAIGHPVGCSGARIIVTLLHELQKRPEAKKGLATLCIGGGMGVATTFEKC